ncbi:MAG: hypothetical protein EHM42_03285 [Planctomycetaceae bacterium]|nr:MAG: hypothetical protein EHM42_03285 [Planctomycetaceae bacterium]
MATTADEPQEPLDSSPRVHVAASKHKASFRREHPIVWWLTLAGPFVLPGGILLMVLQLAGRFLVDCWGGVD